LNALLRWRLHQAVEEKDIKIRRELETIQSRLKASVPKLMPHADRWEKGENSCEEIGAT